MFRTSTKNCWQAVHSAVSKIFKITMVKGNIFCGWGRRNGQKRLFGRSSHPEMFCKKSVLKYLVNLTGKHLCRSLSLAVGVKLNSLTTFTNFVENIWSFGTWSNLKTYFFYKWVEFLKSVNLVWNDSGVCLHLMSPSSLTLMCIKYFCNFTAWNRKCSIK